MPPSTLTTIFFNLGRRRSLSASRSASTLPGLAVCAKRSSVSPRSKPPLPRRRARPLASSTTGTESSTSPAMSTPSLREKYTFWKLPFLRGIATFIDSLRVGFSALGASAEKSGLEDDEEPS